MECEGLPEGIGVQFDFLFKNFDGFFGPADAQEQVAKTQAPVQERPSSLFEGNQTSPVLLFGLLQFPLKLEDGMLFIQLPAAYLAAGPGWVNPSSPLRVVA